MRTPADGLPDALHEGRAFAELDAWTVTHVSGEDARSWLHDLVTTDVEGLARSQTRPSLLLTPTGRIRAAFSVLGLGERDVALAQPADQPEAIGDALAPYVLSSKVEIGPSRLRLFAIPGLDGPPAWAGGAWRPSVLGGGVDLLVGASDDAALADVRSRLAADGLGPVTASDVEARRIRLGEPRFPVDLDGDSLPAEAGWDVAPVTDRAKGCFLGQEAVAKVANLGHPTRLVVAVAAGAPLSAGEPVTADGRDVGAITSASGELGLARIRWDAMDAAWTTASGTLLRRR